MLLLPILLGLCIPCSEADSQTTATFTSIGFLSGDDHSVVRSANNDGTVAACWSFHIDPNFGSFVSNYSARWTVANGLQALPMLPDNPFAGSSTRSQISGNDITPDGSRILFTAHTKPNFSGKAAGICDANGGNVLALSSLPGGENMFSAAQMSDNGLVAFGYTFHSSGFTQSSRWTSSGGFQAFTEPQGYTTSVPVVGGCSADGSISIGDMYTTDSNFHYTSYQAYRWTAGSGMVGVGYLPGGDRSASFALSSNGTTILGVSTSTDFPGDPTQYPFEGEFFLWTAAQGMKSLGRPAGFESLWAGGGGLNSDGSIGVVDVLDPVFGDKTSFVIQTATKLYFDLQTALIQAGAGPAIANWSNFAASISDDGNTVFGSATNPSGQEEGFIAHFPAGFLQNDLGTVNWLPNAANSSWSDPANWSLGGPPGASYTASFSTSNHTAIAFDTFADVYKILFNANASPFSITITNASVMNITGPGIVNNSANIQNFVVEQNAFLVLPNAATAGTSTVLTANSASDSTSSAGQIFFEDTSSANSTTLMINGSAVSGLSGATAYFYGNSSAGNATLVANASAVGGGGGGYLAFFDGSLGGTSRVKVFGPGDFTDGLLYIGGHNFPGLTIGSIEGTGQVFVDSNTLAVGTNNLNTIFSGHVFDFGQHGGFTKTGSGILTLQGRADNDYFDDTMTVNISTGSTINLNFNGTDIVGTLIIDGVVQPPGLHGNGEANRVTQRSLPAPKGLVGSGRLRSVLPVAVSRKIQGASARDIYLPTNGTMGVECRNPGANSSYQIVVSFLNAASFTGASVTSGSGMVTSATGNGTNTATINLANVSSGQTLIVTLFNVNDGNGTQDLHIPMSVLVGDVNGNGSVNSSDIAQVKSKSGQTVDSSNYRMDLNGNGQINSSDLTLAKSKSGTGLTISYSQNFDSGSAPGFNLSGLWHVTQNYPSSGSYSLGFVENETASATPNGDYDNGTDGATAFSGPIAIAGPNPTLTFKAFVGDEWDQRQSDYDDLLVWVSTDGVNFSQAIASSSPHFGDPTIPEWSGPGAQQYHTITVDLSPYNGRVIYLAFSFYTYDDLFNHYPGVRIDDIHVFNGTGSVTQGLQKTNGSRSVEREQRLRRINGRLNAKNRIARVRTPLLPIPLKEQSLLRPKSPVRQGKTSF